MKHVVDKLVKLVKYLFSRSGYRYLFFGGISFLFEISVLYAFANVLQVNRNISVTIAFWLAFIFNFLITKFMTFRDKDTHKKQMAWQSISYGGLVLFNYLFTLFFVNITAAVFSVIVARTIAIVIQTTWNYFIYSHLIFKKPKGSKNQAAA